MTKVIDAWTFLEMLIPRELPSRRDQLERRDIQGGKGSKKVVHLSQSARVKELELANPMKKEMHYRYYMNTYQKHDLILFMRKYFKNDEDLFNRQYVNYYAFTFEVNKTGEYIEDSLFIPQVQLVIDDIQKNKNISYHDFTDRYNEKKRQFEEEFEAIVANGVYEAEIKEIQEVFQKYFLLLHQKTSNSYIECVIRNKDKAKTSSNFNSFYLEDLQMISREGVNDTLAHFINGKSMKVDIDENQQAIEEILAIDNLPLGRWPSPVNHRLSLMQQVAVNHGLNGEELISSVNGPPGTGKTTLLKDIFAELMVKRAEAMISYSDPVKAFKKKGQQVIQFGNSSKSFNYRVYELDEKVAKYSMVVASSNNGAVENISKELPLLKEVIRYKKQEDKELDQTEPYDKTYAEEAEDLNYFRDYAKDLLKDEKAWGLFSAALGRASNIKTIGELVNKGFDEDASFLKKLENTRDEHSWEDVASEFDQLRQEIQADQEELKKFTKEMQAAESIIKKAEELPMIIAKNKKHHNELKKESQYLESQNDLLIERLANLPKSSFIEKIQTFFLGIKNEEEMDIRKQRDEVLKKLSEQLFEKNHCKEKTKELEERKKELDAKLIEILEAKEAYKGEEVSLSTNSFWAAENYAERQKAVIWQSNEINFKRGLLFLKAMKVHKVFLQKSHQEVKLALVMLQELKNNNLNNKKNRENIESMWKILHLIFPVMSTTFASFSSMYDAIGADFIDYLFIDEAGQASPQQAAGALWRSKRAIVVGDPIQIEPVVTLDETILADIREAFEIDEHHIGMTASVQSLADHANPVGSYKDEERIGIPLWVHRRCIEPMFSISNEMAYNNKMVLAVNKEDKDKGKGKWYDISGKAEPKQYVKEQGQFIAEEIKYHFERADGVTLPSVFVITPFTKVRTELKKLVKSTLKERGKEELKVIEEWIDRSIGTVHTFQGKEADIVYFVTGTDDSTDGAANWSCAKPNLLNVATTRAKEEFYVVGDLERFKEKQYYNVIIEKFKIFDKRR